MKFKALIFLIFLAGNIASAIDLMCGSGKHFVHAHFRRAYYRWNGTFVKATHVTAHCQSNQKNYDNWKDNIKYYFPQIWEHIKEHLSPWTDEELERLYEALDEIPDFLLDKKVTIYRLQKSEDNSPASYFKDQIALYDGVFTRKESLERILAHEFAHNWVNHMAESDFKSYEDAAGWHRKTHDVSLDPWIRRADGYIRPDARLNPTEDLAVNIESYIFEPHKLEKLAPDAYNWLKKKFGVKIQKRGRS